MFNLFPLLLYFWPHSRIFWNLLLYNSTFGLFLWYFQPLIWYFWTFFIYILLSIISIVLSIFSLVLSIFSLVLSTFFSSIFDLNIIGYWCGVDHYVIFQYWVVGVTVGWLHIQETHILFLFFHILFSHFFISDILHEINCIKKSFT